MTKITFHVNVKNKLEINDLKINPIVILFLTENVQNYDFSETTFRF